MSPSISRICLPWITLLLLSVAPIAGAQDIYKCTHGGTVAYTDHPCTKGKGELLHQANDSEVIDKYLRLGQDSLARQYADARHLDALYKERLDAYQQAQDEKARQQQDEALAARQREDKARQQALLDQLSDRNRLQAENNALRQQNDQYRDELTQPVDNSYPAVGWGVLPSPYYRPPYRDPTHGHDRDHWHYRPQPKEPVFHPCTQLAGGRVRC
ncbi:MAG TPA: DUF4124 domain-containing protein [Rhodanobacter sp.]|nr:DUF4124 domain-containing protein [Rhodanobacter sp.]